MRSSQYRFIKKNYCRHPLKKKYNKQETLFVECVSNICKDEEICSLNLWVHSYQFNPDFIKKKTYLVFLWRFMTVFVHIMSQEIIENKIKQHKIF